MGDESEPSENVVIGRLNSYARGHPFLILSAIIA